MKKITQKIVLLLSLCVFTLQLNAQFTATDALDEIISFSEDIDGNATSANITLRTLVIDYLLNENPNPNTAGFLANMLQEMEEVEEYSDEINQYAYYAWQLNNNVDTSNISDLAGDLEANGDYVEIDSQALVTAVENQDDAAVLALNSSIRTRLNLIISIADQIATEAEELKAAAVTYNVRIELVDYMSGNPVSADNLEGYGAVNLDTNERYYTGGRDYYEPIDIFNNLPAGTYRFDGFDGPWDGSSSKTVTLSDDLVGTDGYIVVTLSYWYE